MVSVMVVEDWRDIRELLADALSFAGFKVIEVATADEAARLLHREQLRLLLIDVELPGTLDGIALARVARQQFPMIPVVFTSASISKLIDARSTAAPVCFLLKPFSLTSLLAHVHRLTDAPFPVDSRFGVEFDGLRTC